MIKAIKSDITKVTRQIPSECLYSRPKLTAVLKTFAAVYAVPVNSCLRQSLTGTSIFRLSKISG